MQNEKRKNLIIIILVAIIVALSTILVLLLTGVLNFENENKSPNKENDTVENGRHNEDTTSEYANWMNYLLETDIQEIKVTRIRSVAFGDKEEYNKTITLSVDDLKDSFKEMNNYELVKQYAGGIGGPNKESFEVTYLVNGVKYKFEIRYGLILVDNLDDEILEILNNNNYPIRDEENKDIPGSFYFFRFDTSDDIFSIFDKYFEAK